MIMLSNSNQKSHNSKMLSTRSSTKFKFSEGERVLCFEPDPTKARVLYDAKILEINVKKDNRGRKSVEYLIHFQGWNSSWDRYVPESYILPNIEENRIVQKDLADAARTLLREKRKRRQKIAGSLKGAEPKYRTDSDASSVEDVDVSNMGNIDDDHVNGNDEKESSERSETLEAPTDQIIQLNIPESIKGILEEDYVHMCHQRKVLKIPCEPTVAGILESFVNQFAVHLSNKHSEKPRGHRSSTSSNTSLNAGEVAGCSANGSNSTCNLSLCKEVMDGIRVSFDFLLPLMLLYPDEKSQYERTKNDTHFQYPDYNPIYKFSTSWSGHDLVKSADSSGLGEVAHWHTLPDSLIQEKQFLPCTVYGAIHLLRLLVKLPDVLQRMSISDTKRKVIVHYVEILLQFMAAQTNFYSPMNYRLNE